MCEESREWIKLGGKPFFCFSVLGFLCVGLGYAQVKDPVPLPWSAPPSVLTQQVAECQSPSPSLSFLVQLPPPLHSLVGVPTAAEGETLDPSTDL